MRLAAIMTCHDRKEKTLACLRSFLSLISEAEVFLTDDGCTDGTTESVKKMFPQVNIVIGNGNLYWSRGMYTAWKEAIKGKYDYYLWLNDDIELYQNVITELMECERIGGGNCIVSGLIESFDRSKILYGGTNSQKQLITSSSEPQPITNMNGNVVLIPQSVVDRIGIIDSRLHHDLGDVDYGLTAIENGIKVLSTRTPVAAGYANDFCRVRKWGTNLSNRLRKLRSPLGSPPSINFHFRKKHYGLLNASVYWCYLYFINFMPDNVIELLFGEAYKDKKQKFYKDE